MRLQLGDQLLMDLHQYFLALRIKVQNQLVARGIPALRDAENLVVSCLALVNTLAAFPFLGCRPLGLLRQMFVLDHFPDLVAALGGVVFVVFI
jgi:hypothetical protein